MISDGFPEDITLGDKTANLIFLYLIYRMVN